MMGVGKSTLGKIVAKRQGLKFLDTDSNIEKKYSMTISKIFEKKGEKFFRLLEEKEVLESLKKSNCVISIGGGAFMSKLVREKILKNSISIWLDLDIETINKRIKWIKKRPLLNEKNKEKKLLELYNERRDVYSLAKYKIDCNNITKENIIKKIIYLHEKN